VDWVCDVYFLQMEVRRTVVVVTASHEAQAQAVEQELRARQITDSEIGGQWKDVEVFVVPGE
jgi:hypothetical protein